MGKKEIKLNRGFSTQGRRHNTSLLIMDCLTSISWNCLKSTNGVNILSMSCQTLTRIIGKITEYFFCGGWDKKDISGCQS